MRLFFDARYIRTDQHDGISRYSAELAAAVNHLRKVTFIICDNKQLEKLPQNADFVKIHKPTSMLEPFASLILNKYNPDVVFSPMQTIGSIGKKFKLILTVHDLIYYRHNKAPKHFNFMIRFIWWVYHLSYYPEKLILSKADLVATVSESTKQDLIKERLTNIPIVVTHNAPPSIKSGAKKSFNAPINLVYMGSFIGYKNVETLILAMEYLAGFKLHLLSKISSSRLSELEAIVPSGSYVKFYGGVSDDEYQKLLLDNAILVSASKDEGYGLPIAEALMQSVPVVVSDISIFQEVAGAGGLYFEHSNPKMLAQQVLKLQDKSTYLKHASAGKKHIEQFNWNKSASQLMDKIDSYLLK
jgi:glycosyltransferase involved in cell wall biosynthesis